MRALSQQDFKRSKVKNPAAGIFETNYSVIKESARPKTDGAQGPRTVRVSEPPSKNPPEISWSESRGHYGLRMKQLTIHTNRKTFPRPEMEYLPGPNDTIRKLVHPPPPRQPPMSWNIETIS